MRRVGNVPVTLALGCVALLASCVPARSAARPDRARVAAPRSYVEQFDTLWARFDAVYPSFTYKQVDWIRQRDQYRRRAERARSQNELVATLLAMLAPLRDRHVWLIDPKGHVVPTYRPVWSMNFDRARWQQAMREVGYTARRGEAGDAMIGGYGYLHIGSWRPPVDTLVLDAMLERYRDAPGLILDVRTNAGGRDALALDFARRFTTRAFAASYVQVRTEFPGLDLPLARTIAPRGVWQFTKPVVVLTGRGGLSATESFVAALRTMPQVTVMGDTTGGASGNPVVLPLGNGWRFTVPRWMEYGPDQRPIEWRGVAPHLAFPWHPDAFGPGRDPLIDAAVGLLGERTGVYRMAPPAEPSSVRDP